MGGDPMEQRPVGVPVGVAVIDDHQVVIDGVRAWAAADPAKAQATRGEAAKAADFPV